MILADYHVHSEFSTDSETPMLKMVERAHELGFHSLCFTDHMDYDFPEKYVPECWKPPLFVFDPDRYGKRLDELVRKNPTQVKIYKGVELGLRPYLAEKNKELLDGYPWDFVIGSVHVVNGSDPYHADYWYGITEHEGVLRFFECTLECVKRNMDFDVLGHMDYIFRYAPSKNRFFTYAAYSDVLDEILRKLIEQGKGLEVNASGLKAGLGAPNPHPDILLRYKELGGETLTVGSDAHTTDYLGYSFQEIRESLRSMGFRYYTVFKERKAEFLPL